MAHWQNHEKRLQDDVDKKWLHAARNAGLRKIKLTYCDLQRMNMCGYEVALIGRDKYSNEDMSYGTIRLTVLPGCCGYGVIHDMRLNHTHFKRGLAKMMLDVCKFLANEKLKLCGIIATIQTNQMQAAGKLCTNHLGMKEVDVNASGRTSYLLTMFAKTFDYELKTTY